MIPAIVPIIAAGVSAIGSVASNVITNQQNKKNVEQSFQNSLAAQSMQNSWNAAQVDKAREYNLPVNEKQRLLDAGLNPNLLYGQYSSANVSPASGTAPQQQSAVYQSPVGDLSSVVVNSMMAAKQSELIDSQISLNDAEVEKKNADTAKAYSEIQVNDHMKLQIDKGLELSDAQINNLAHQARLIDKQILQVTNQAELLQVEMANLNQDIALKEIEKTFRSQEFVYKLREIASNIRLNNSKNALNEKELQFLTESYVNRLLGVKYDAEYKDLENTLAVRKIVGLDFENERLGFNLEVDKSNYFSGQAWINENAFLRSLQLSLDMIGGVFSFNKKL